MKYPPLELVLEVDDRRALAWKDPQKDQFRRWVQQFRPGTRIVLVAKRYLRRRTLDQNAGFHAMITPWAQQEGHDIDELKRDLMGEIFGWLEVASLVTGEVKYVPRIPHTSDLDTEQFSLLIERTLEIAARCGVYLVSPAEWTAINEGRLRVGTRG
jgi:hypothetical protein